MFAGIFHFPGLCWIVNSYSEKKSSKPTPEVPMQVFILESVLQRLLIGYEGERLLGKQINMEVTVHIQRQASPSRRRHSLFPPWS